jgi:hypothetical protein
MSDSTTDDGDKPSQDPDKGQTTVVAGKSPAVSKVISPSQRGNQLANEASVP